MPRVPLRRINMESSSNEEFCFEAGCAVRIVPHTKLWIYEGRPYCGAHYWKAMRLELMTEHGSCNPLEAPSQRFRYLLGRLFEGECRVTKGESYLSSARIRDRGFDFVRTETGCSLSITRRPGAFKNLFVTKGIVQRWDADLADRSVRLIRTGNWREGNRD